ncbi:MAG: c-type cytochrome [Chloroflexi bacterium]|nr:c-type cytochrome [Chloroflexota bacterium]
MNLGTYEGILLGGDVLSAPPGVAVVLPGDWANSKLRERLRNNRMPPGWEFDIEEGNRNGPVLVLGVPAESAAEPTPTSEAVIAPAPATEPTTAPTAVPTPAPTREETTVAPPWPWALALMSGLGMVLGIAVAFIYFNRLRLPDSSSRLADTLSFVLGIATVLLGAVLLQTAADESLTRVTTIREKAPFLVVATPTAHPGVIFESVEGRIEAWQARIPAEYAGLANPYTPNDAEAVNAGRRIFRDHNCGVCHGNEMKGDGEFSEALNPRPVDLTDKALMSLPFMTDTYLYWRISEGGSQTPFLSAMPQWKVKLTEEERWQLVAYIRSQTAEQVSDEDQAAIAVIEKAGCFACHRLDNRGGTIGPEWNGIGETAANRVGGVSAEEYIHQSIVDPGAFTVPGYEDKAETMPRDFAQKLTAEEIDIIVQYLLQQDND